MRDYRDAKAMARRLREALAERGAHLAHSDCLELIARSFGLKDWHVLSALIEAAAPPDAVAIPDPTAWTGPALLLRDIVVFPKVTVPVFVGREMSVRAQQRAHEGELEVLLVTQKERSDDKPAADAIYEVGIIADVLERSVLGDGSVMGPAFVETLPVTKFYGVGPVTAAKMHKLGIQTGADLKDQTLEFLQGQFGKSGPWYYETPAAATSGRCAPTGSASRLAIRATTCRAERR